jgi:hypothetical protein
MADASVTVASSTQIAYVSSGASIAAAAFNVSTDIANALTSTNMKRWPRCDATLMVSQGSSTASTLMAIPLFRRDINIDGTSDEAIPGTLTQAHFVGNFILASSTSTAGAQYMKITDIPLPATTDCEFYISNALTNLISAGWTLKITPKTDVGSTV